MKNQINVGNQNTQQVGQNRPRFNIPIGRLILALAILVLIIGVAAIVTRKEKNWLKPSPVSAAEIIRRSLEKFILPHTIYHQKTKQYLRGSNEPNTYEIWEDQEEVTSSRFYNEATYSDGRKTVQGFNLEFRWDIDYQTKTIHKDIYVYNNQSGPQPVGRRVDIAEQFDELIRNGILKTKEGKLDGREVYVIYDTRASPEKYWDILTFDKNTFQILKTEKYGADRKIEELTEYETQEAIERNEANLAKFFTYQEPDGGFALYQRNFYTSKPDQEDYVLISGTPQLPQVTTPPTPKPITEERKTYQTNNFSIKYPSNWKINTQQIEYYDPPTLVLTMDGGKKTFGGYELPQLWIGSFEIYSTSGAICANEPYCKEVGKINFQIKNKTYSSPIFERKIITSGQFTGNEPSFYVFQVELENVPSNPTVTGQFDATTSQSEIEKILSSISY